jgi:Uma2 family endonuclease
MIDPVVTNRFTRKDYDLLPEGFPAQLVRGLLVKEPAPTYGHARLSSRLCAALTAIVGPDRAIHAPADVAIDDYNVFQPDVLVLRAIPPGDHRDVGVPLLAIEVLSPSTARRDREVKRRRLLAAGTAEVWIIDPVAEVVEVYDAEGVRNARGDASIASEAVPGFAVVPADLFRRSSPQVP